MNTLTLTLSDRAYYGLIEAGNRNGTTAEAIATELLTNQGNSYAELFRLGVITSAALMAKFTSDEYAAIRTASETNPEVASLIQQLTGSPNVSFEDPRLEQGLNLLISLDLITEERKAELLSYDHPTPQPVGE